MAERLRESDEILHTGVAAYNAGDIDRARELLTQAVEQGTDGADILLGRLNRVSGSGTPDTRFEPRARMSAPDRGPLLVQRRRWAAVTVVACAIAAVVFLGSLPFATWLSAPAVSGPALAPAVIDEPLPVVRTAEMAIVRARELYAGGQFHEALRTLDRVAFADPVRGEADRLRADIQRGLLEAAGLHAPSTQDGGSSR
jgi:hypothetical protein